MSSAAGRAYLAFCSKRECQRLLKEIAEQRGEPVIEGIDHELTHTRKRGYAVRGEHCVGGTERYPYRKDQLSAVALPIIHKAKVICCINLLWPSGFTDIVGGEAAMAELLGTYVRKIEQNLASTANARCLSAAFDPDRRTGCVHVRGSTCGASTLAGSRD